MDFEAPPPFVGALDEIPDVECDVRMTVDDEEEFSTGHLEIPTDLPCTSSSASLQFPSCRQNSATKDSDDGNEKCLGQNHPSLVISGLPEDREPDRTSVDFGSFAKQRKCELHGLDSLQDIDDEFGDFADFTGQDRGTSEINEAGLSEPLPQRSFSEDFHSSGQNAEDSKPQIWLSTVDESGEDDEWNAFGSLQEYRNDKDWSADFEDFDKTLPEVVDGPTSDSSPLPSNVPISETLTSPILDDLCNSVDLWNVESEIGDEKGYNIINLLDSDASEVKENSAISFLKGYELWLALRIVEDALALKFEWKGSQHRVNLFRALGVDPVDDGCVSSSPSMFTVLEPTPLIANGTTRRSVIISREGGAHDAKVVSAEAPASDSQSTAATLPIESPSIPSADFDWEKSDLVNPTMAANRSSALLDVDFLWANSGGGNSSAISTLQKELDQLGLSNTLSQTRAKPENQPSMLDVVMASATKLEKKIVRPPSELSLDARALHDQLPDISFLRATMIMFPIGENRFKQS
uniref:Clathrin_bdg domain-containing protein n=1 Tax=Angiostrongylus cantonensis TaxID=6313 RepID=A0A158P6S5_ANGCA